MLLRFLVAAACLELIGCSRQAQFVGEWRWRGDAEAGRIKFARDHTFAMAKAGWQTPPVLRENGTWTVQGDTLTLDFDSPYRPKPDEKHITLAILRIEPTRIAMRSCDGKNMFTLERTR
jgi:hypothetical protein